MGEKRMAVVVKKERVETTPQVAAAPEPTSSRSGDVSKCTPTVIDLDSSSSSSSSSSSDSDSDDEEALLETIGINVGEDGGLRKKRKLNELGVGFPVGFDDIIAPLLLPEPEKAGELQEQPSVNATVAVGNKQFWKAGDYEGAPCSDWDSSSGGMDHVRVHPKFLHSNATSHKWALGAFAELLDNALDEVCNGATYVNINMLLNKKDKSRMLLIEDNGGGMDPDKMRHCMSLGYSAKSKVANTIGQYGNGFKTSTMRLGADVIVFSRCSGKDGKSPTQSIGLLSYTFLRSTGKEDIVVPMLDYERGGGQWNKMIRSSIIDWNRNVETIVQWSPFSSEVDLLNQFCLMKDHGTRIIIYNLWEDDQGQLELDFDADPHDIQIRGVNRDEKNILMAKEYPNSRHFLTYRHSLRSYASILYLRLPPGFRIILRGIDVEHHNIVNDMMMSQEVTYRPQAGADGILKDSNMVAVVTIGFVKDAKYHIDVQGFNVYHKNRLIKPFWRLWNAAGSDGRGVIGVLEANFVEPAHDKQGFERTTVLARLEARLVQMQKTYWTTNCHRIGYAPRRNKKLLSASAYRENSPDYLLQSSPSRKNGTNSSKWKTSPVSDKFQSSFYQKHGRIDSKYGKIKSSSGPSSHLSENDSEDDIHITIPEKQANNSSHKAFPAHKAFRKDSPQVNRSLNMEDYRSQQDHASGGSTISPTTGSWSKGGGVNNTNHLSDSDLQTPEQLREENHELKERLKKREEELQELQYEKDRCKSLETQLQKAEEKIDELNKEQESLIDIFSEERERRDNEEKNLRRKLQEASNTIQELLDKVRLLEKMKLANGSNGVK
ncbi:protein MICRORCHIDIA 7 [Ziziphus jujuba]|uniref:Protein MICRORCHIDIA 7 n=1 Tax=Ziziphus jujuba TaxID=326968 RepID=A0ABM3IK84_ZIZJJ|nr:protein MICRORCHIDIA 7 [Ziziphus jujuba]